MKHTHQFTIINMLGEGVCGCGERATKADIRAYQQQISRPIFSIFGYGLFRKN